MFIIFRFIAGNVLQKMDHVEIALNFVAVTYFCCCNSFVSATFVNVASSKSLFETTWGQSHIFLCACNAAYCKRQQNVPSSPSALFRKLENSKNIFKLGEGSLPFRNKTYQKLRKSFLVLSNFAWPKYFVRPKYFVWNILSGFVTHSYHVEREGEKPK